MFYRIYYYGMCGKFFYQINERTLRVIYKILGIIITAFAVVISVLFLTIGARQYYYPLKYDDEIIVCAREFNLDAALVFAVVREESRFVITAKSSAGAKGLMQITDATGEYIAQKMNISDYDLFDVKTNLRFGCYYLKYLIDRFNNVETALAAYNAGEGNVSAWLLDSRYSDDKITLKTVPFIETREYIVKIKKSFEKYKKLYGKILDKRQNIE